MLCYSEENLVSKFLVQTLRPKQINQYLHIWTPFCLPFGYGDKVFEKQISYCGSLERYNDGGSPIVSIRISEYTFTFCLASCMGPKRKVFGQESTMVK